MGGRLRLGWGSGPKACLLFSVFLAYLYCVRVCVGAGGGGYDSIGEHSVGEHVVFPRCTR